MFWTIKVLSFQKQTNKIRVSLSSPKGIVFSSSCSDLTRFLAQCDFWRWSPLNEWLLRTLVGCFHHRESDISRNWTSPSRGGCSLSAPEDSRLSHEQLEDYSLRICVLHVLWFTDLLMHVNWVHFVASVC